ncbi:hypothetical protein [Vogesella indigofera]|uniref:Uncharacterized protein n=1 Tax=Vogesella indigofera TaxID=45465 RepID=A0ABT5I8N9_VOGIN|nr:hypothetical protein [Vogesella indigofera]MDC7692551.1 hypothetical protein [Vogesella indigofera]
MYELIFAALIAAHLSWLIFRHCRHPSKTHWGVLVLAWFIILAESLIAIAMEWPSSSKFALVCGLAPGAAYLVWVTLRKLIIPRGLE